MKSSLLWKELTRKQDRQNVYLPANKFSGFCDYNIFYKRVSYLSHTCIRFFSPFSLFFFCYSSFSQFFSLFLPLSTISVHKEVCAYQPPAYQAACYRTLPSPENKLGNHSPGENGDSLTGVCHPHSTWVFTTGS